MGQHKYNPIAIAFRNGLIPKKKKHISKKEAEKIAETKHQETLHKPVFETYDHMDKGI